MSASRPPGRSSGNDGAAMHPVRARQDVPLECGAEGSEELPDARVAGQRSDNRVMHAAAQIGVGCRERTALLGPRPPDKLLLRQDGPERRLRVIGLRQDVCVGEPRQRVAAGVAARAEELLRRCSLLLPPFADHLVVRLDIETDAAQRHPA